MAYVQANGQYTQDYPATIFADAVQRYSGIGSSSFHWIEIGFDPVWAYVVGRTYKNITFINRSFTLYPIIP